MDEAFAPAGAIDINVRISAVNTGRAVFVAVRREACEDMVCLGCFRQALEVNIERLQTEIAEKHGYEIEDHSLVIYVRPKTKS